MPILKPDTAPRVTVLLALRNGAAFLQAQLASLAAQTLPPALILVAGHVTTIDQLSNGVYALCISVIDEIGAADAPCFGFAYHDGGRVEPEHLG